MSKIDWSKAPECAEFYANTLFYKDDIEYGLLWHDRTNEWHATSYKLRELKEFDDYEERPQKPATQKADNVRKPSHYQLIDGIESIEIIARSMTAEQWKGFCLGNMLKYRIRAGKKDALQQDIDKANYYGELYELHKDKCYESNN
jgi:hypothetical protein